MAKGHGRGGLPPMLHVTPDVASHHPALAEASAAPPQLRRGVFPPGYFRTTLEQGLNFFKSQM